MRIAIVEDVPEDQDLLAGLLSKYLDDRSIACRIDIFKNGDEFLQVGVADAYDLCFLDIFLDGTNGMETARQLAARDPECLIIFLTHSPDFMSEGYDVRAWRYVLKPISSDILHKLMPTCLEKLVLSKRRLEVLVNRRPCVIPYSQIHAVVTVERRTVIRTGQATLVLGTQVQFSELVAPLMEDFRFLLIGKGQMVNLAQVRDIVDGCILLRCNERLFISRRQRAAVTEQFMNFRLNNE